MNTKQFINSVILIVLHTFFWVGVYFFYTYFLGYGSKNTAYVNNFALYLMPVTIIMSYFFLYVLIPKYLIAKKHGLFVLYTVYTFIVSFCLIMLSILYGIVFSTDLTINDSKPLTKTILFIILGIYMVVLVVIAIGLVLSSYKSTLKNEDLKTKFLETKLQLKEQELRFLKMQIQPHFLFNTLNTIYGLAIQKHENAPEMILKLSNLLDYILYQVDKPKVFLMDEIAHLEDYISLEKMRFHDTLKINFIKNIQAENVDVSPMLLIPFVENAFKHGVIVNNFFTINIDLKVTETKLYFTIENNYNKEKENIQGGIGLENSRKRLEMLYPEKHSLEIIGKDNIFKIILEINF
ncbi:histidine kinase [Polaribacter haliotis]|uniref:Histidine kinase n=1 Tax=Polaribacter haliotis TaxID=1888915 RepID=A0A7L8AEU4_9FLAO|nr:histidine kinase [Polaribacter haliotis]QOD60521.1 histidine kinase [Polaribacter haliotis]